MPIMHLSIILLLFALSCNPPAKAPVPLFIKDYPHQDGTDQLLWTADSLKYIHHLEEAAQKFEHLCTENSTLNAEQRTYCLNQAAYLQLKMGYWNKGKAWIDSLDHMIRDDKQSLSLGAQGDQLFNKALWANYVDDPYLSRDYFIMALNCYKKAYRSDDLHFKEAETSVMLALWCTDYVLDSAYYYVRNSKNLFDSLHKTAYKHLMSNYYLAQSKLCYFDREYPESISILKSAARIFDKNQFQDSTFLAQCNIEMNRSFCALGKFNDAEKHLGIGKSFINSKSPEYISQLYYHEKATLLTEIVGTRDTLYKDKKEDARAAFFSVIQKIEQTWTEPTLRHGFPYLLKAYYYNFGDINKAKALENFELAMQKYMNLPLCNAFYKETLLDGITQANIKVKNYTKAIEYAKQYILFNSARERDYNSISWDDLLKPRLLKSKNYLYIPYRLAGMAFLERYKVSSYNTNDLDRAYKIFWAIHKLLDRSIRSQSEAAINRIVQEEAEGIYALAVETAYLLHKKHPTNRQYLDAAFNFMEKQKAYLLFSKVSEYKSQEGKFEYERFALRTNVLYDSIDDLNEQIASRASGADPRRLESLKIQLDALLDSIQQNSKARDYMQDTLPSLTQIQQKMKKNEAILEYFLNSENCFLILIKPDTVILTKTCKVDSIFNANIDNFSAHFNSESISAKAFQDLKQFSNYVQSAQVLFRDLVGAINNLLKDEDLIIITDKTTSNINFEALLPPSSKPIDMSIQNYGQLPYWIKDHTILYSPSYLMYFKKEQQQCPQSPKMLALSSPNFKDHLKDINEYYPKAHIARKEIQSKAQFHDLLSEHYDIIYIFAHGTGATKANGCRLYFDQDTLTSEKSILGNEIPKLDTTQYAPIVVLSACEGALGSKSGSETPYTFAWYFMKAGAGTVVSSYNKINTPISRILVANFFKELNTGKTPEHALRAAKLSYLEDDEQYHEPFYWASLLCFK